MRGRLALWMGCVVLLGSVSGCGSGGTSADSGAEDSGAPIADVGVIGADVMTPPVDAGGPPFAGLIDWSSAGYVGEIPDVDTNTVAVACGVADDHAEIQAAIDGALPPAVILLPSGTCRIEARLDFQSGVVLRGAGSEQSVLECLSASGCIGINGSPDGEYVAIRGGLEQGSTEIEVADASGFSGGGGAEIRQDDIIAPAASWGADVVGQMATVVDVSGTTLTIRPPLHLAYDASANPQARPVDFIKQVGVEDLRLVRIDSGGSDESNVEVRRAADCWIRRIESDFTEKYHFAVTQSLHLEIRDSYIHDARSRGDGGQGYGVSLGRRVTSILVENNIFSDNRHAMIVQMGSNGNVFAYNYAQRNYSDDGADKSYITLHGHYPFMNLYESNVVGRIDIDGVWGSNGPGNVLFRNRVLGTDGGEGFGERRGVNFVDYHGAQYLVGNDIHGEGVLGDTSDVVMHGNQVNGEIGWDPTMPDHSLPPSYYLASKPAFYGAMNWPSVGGDLDAGGGSIPALERWSSGQHVPQPR